MIHGRIRPLIGHSRRPLVQAVLREAHNRPAKLTDALAEATLSRSLDLIALGLGHVLRVVPEDLRRPANLDRNRSHGGLVRLPRESDLVRHPSELGPHLVLVLTVVVAHVIDPLRIALHFLPGDTRDHVRRQTGVGRGILDMGAIGTDPVPPLRVGVGWQPPILVDRVPQAVEARADVLKLRGDPVTADIRRNAVDLRSGSRESHVRIALCLAHLTAELRHPRQQGVRPLYAA